MPRGEKLLLRNKLGQFIKGHTSWNKGLKRPMSLDHRAKLSAVHRAIGTRPPSRLGTVSSSETRAKQAIAGAKAVARKDYWRNPSDLEHAMSLLLQNAELEFQSQVRFGRCG